MVSANGSRLPGANRVQPAVRLGLRENWPQFTLLVLVNGFVGAMVGIERTVVPLLAEHDFELASRAAILSFILSFGLVKALANLAAGRLSDRVGRKPILVAGWLIGLPVPLLIIWAPSWAWIVFANVLLGVNQGLCWSTTVIMKIDIVGPARRGFAMGLNEFAGYLAAGAAALGSGVIAANYGLRPYPFYLGIGFAISGLFLSAVAVRETRNWAEHEARLSAERRHDQSGLTFWQVFALTSWRDRALFATSQAGLVNNLNDGLAWGLLPLFFTAHGLGVAEVGVLSGTYLGVWGASQLVTGALSDRIGRKPPIVFGMWLQAAAIVLLLAFEDLASWLLCMGLFGLGTALVYPTLLAAVSDVAHPTWRASAVGIYRLWRDSGYAVGALLVGFAADAFGLPAAIAAVSGLTFISGAVVLARMYETLQRPRFGST